MRAWSKGLGLAALFCGLTALGVWWALSQVDLEAEHWGQLLALEPGWLVVWGLLAAGVMVTEALRFRACGRIFEVEVGWWAAIDATIANAFFAWLTPGAALSEPATIYMLGRRGVSWSGAVALCLLKATTSSALFLGAAFVLLLAGLGPDLALGWWLPFVSGTGVVATMLAALLLGALRDRAAIAWLARRRQRLEGGRLGRWPRLVRWGDRLLETTQRSVERLATLRRARPGPLLWLLITHLLYYGCFIGVFVALALALADPPPGRLVATAIIYQTFTYVAPTPGGAGLSEAVSVAFFDHLLAPRHAVLAVLGFRASTFYLHLLLGAVYLPMVGGIRAVLEGRTGEEPEARA